MPIASALRSASARLVSFRVQSSLTRTPSYLLQQRPLTTTRTLRQDSDAYKLAHESIQAKFVEARDEYETALESANTTYAYEDNEVARLVSRELQELWSLHAGVSVSATTAAGAGQGEGAVEVEEGEGALQLPKSTIIDKLKEKDEYNPVDLTDADRQKLKERLGARIRELVNGVENNLHDH